MIIVSSDIISEMRNAFVQNWDSWALPRQQLLTEIG